MLFALLVFVGTMMLSSTNCSLSRLSRIAAREGGCGGRLGRGACACSVTEASSLCVAAAERGGRMMSGSMPTTPPEIPQTVAPNPNAHIDGKVFLGGLGPDLTEQDLT